MQPQLFSPRVAPLRVERSSCLGPRSPGCGWRRSDGRALGWLLPLRSRRRIELTWHGRLAGRPCARRAAIRLQLVVDERAGRARRLPPGRDPTEPDRLPGHERRAAVRRRQRAADDDQPRSGHGPDDGAHRLHAEREPLRRVVLAPNDERRRTVTTSRRTWRPAVTAITWTPARRSSRGRTSCSSLRPTRRATGARYGAETRLRRPLPRAPVVRVLGVEAAFDRQSYAPGDTATLRVSTDASAFTLGLFRAPGRSRSRPTTSSRARRSPSWSRSTGRAMRTPRDGRGADRRGLAERPLLRRARTPSTAASATRRSSSGRRSWARAAGSPSSSPPTRGRRTTSTTPTATAGATRGTRAAATCASRSTGRT